MRHTCTVPSQEPLQKALPLGLAATSSTASVCPLYTARQLAGCCPSPDDAACIAGADHRRMVWSLAADRARGPCAEGRMETALMPLVWALCATGQLPTACSSANLMNAHALEPPLELGNLMNA